jgi:hypothetical protein
MQTNLVLEKTATGREAIQNGTPRLEGKLRTALIFVDGRKGVAALTERMRDANMGDDTESLVMQLLAQGMIQYVSAPPAPSSALADEQQEPTPSYVEQRSPQKLGSQLFEEAVGIRGLSLARALETAPDHPHFEIAARKAHLVLVGMRGLPVADAFLRRLGMQQAA